jgi:hypothetical protein
MTTSLRFDFVFSYWITTLWVLYITGFTHLNPKLLLVLGVIENTILFFFLPKEKRFIFIFINFFIKVVPLYTVWNTKILKKDVVQSTLLFLAYLAWLKLNNQPLILKDRTPMTDFLLLSLQKRNYNIS